MSKNFFTELSDELLLMKDSPFIRIGQNPPKLSKSLSFNPDRLFDPEKQKEEEKHLEEDYARFLQKEKEQQIDLENQALIKLTKEEYEKQIKNMQLKRTSSQEPYSIFGSYRGFCSCKKCDEYSGCFNTSQRYAINSNNFIEKTYYNTQTKPIDFMKCYNCNCPMNSHTLISSSPSVPIFTKIYSYLSEKSIHEKVLNTSTFILSFKFNESNISKYTQLLSFISNLQCEVINYKTVSKLDYELNVIKYKILETGNAEKIYMESLINLADSLGKELEWRWSGKKGSEYHELYGELFESLERIGCKVEKELGIGDRECVVVFLCRYPYNIKSLVKYLFECPNNPQSPVLFTSKETSLIHATLNLKESLLISQFIFPEIYLTYYSIFLFGGQLHDIEGKKEIERNISRFRDLMDYNDYNVYWEGGERNRTDFEKVLQNVCGWRTNKIGYILGDAMLSERIKLPLNLCLKVGSKELNLPGEFPEFIQIGSNETISKMLSCLNPEFIHSQRVVFIIKPYVINEGYEEIISNILRVNKFIVIKRVRLKLSESEARYVGTLENIDPAIMETYIGYMTSGVCEILLVSKRAAIYEAYALAHGCLNGPAEIEGGSLKGYGKDGKISVQYQRGKDIYEEELPIHKNASKTQVPFKSIKSLFSIERALFGHTDQPQYTTNVRTNQITKIESSASEKDVNTEPIHATHKMKESILQELRKSNHNFWLYTSKSETLTEELTGLFLPECTLFEPITILVKPGVVHLIDLIKKCLIEHKYHIITEKEVKLTRAQATELVYNCQKIRMTSEVLKEIVDAYTKEKVYILCLSKISGRKEIMSMLSGFSFLVSLPSPKSQAHSQKHSNLSREIYIENEYISDETLCSMLVPIWNNEELLHSLICAPLAHLEESVRILHDEEYKGIESSLSKIEKYIVLNYLIGSFYGVSIENLTLESRLGKFTYYITSDPIIAKLQSWYYSTISNIKPHYVPLLFQYRPIGETTLSIQSHRGFRFVDILTEMWIEEQEKIKKLNEGQNTFEYQYQYKQKSNKKRGSLVLFLWAKKIKEMCLDLSEIETSLKDFGEIIYKNTEFQGSHSLEQSRKEEEIFLSKLYREFESEQDIRSNIKKLMDSRHLKERYKNTSKRLLPSFSISGSNYIDSIRVLEKTEVSKLLLMNKYEFIDPLNENEDLKDLYTLHLFNVVPEIRTKYSLLAEIHFFLERLEIENEEMSIMIEELINIFDDLLTDIDELDEIEYEIYLRFLLEYASLPDETDEKIILFAMLKKFPNLKASKKIDRDEAGGKRRKFLEYKQYFKRKEELSKETRETINKKYQNIDPYEDINAYGEKLIDLPKPSLLYDPKDPLHERFARPERRINLLREVKEEEKQRTGIFVEYEKNISEKEELLKQKIKKEVEKFNYHNEDEILQETGLEKDLWYRKTKGAIDTEETKTNTAINKQIMKLMAFKQSEDKRKSEKTID